MVQVSTDGFKCYPEAVDLAFGPNVKFGTIVKEFRNAKRIYTRLGHPERVDLVETDATHGYSLKLREASVCWMRRWLVGDDRPIVEKIYLAALTLRPGEDEVSAALAP